MSTNIQGQPLFSHQVETCLICNKQPVPQSSQTKQFVLAEIILLFFNWKLSLMLLALGFYFSQTIWVCPVCKRTIDIRNADKQVEENVIIRLGNCIGIVSKEKYLIGALVVCLIILINMGTNYWYQQKRVDLDTEVVKSWPYLARDCGRFVLEDNQVVAHNRFLKYKELDWELKGIWLDVRNQSISNPVFNIKMDPTQYPNSTRPDIFVYTYGSDNNLLNLTQGDWVSFKGQFSLLTSQGFHFAARQITKLSGKNLNINTIGGIEKPANLRNQNS